MKYIIKCPDGTRWKVREAVSLTAALDEIAHARATGSIGSASREMMLHSGNPYPNRILADVIQINSDGSERQPYTKAY